MGTPNEFVILITGCSTGIGRSLTGQLASMGHKVIATARRLESIADLASDTVAIFALDVTDDASISAAVAAGIKHFGKIDILINNAGYGLIGPMAEVPLSDFRAQIDTNITGPVALVQAVVPHMVKNGGGRIVNMGSVSGITATPYAGPYCASKAAIHMISDALRIELKPFNIDVILIQPGGIRTNFGDTAIKSIERYKTKDSLYMEGYEGIEARAMMSQGSPTSVEDFSRSVAQAITGKRPPAVLRLGHGSTLMPLLKHSLSTARLDKILTKKFSVHKVGKK